MYLRYLRYLDKMKSKYLSLPTVPYLLPFSSSSSSYYLLQKYVHMATLSYTHLTLLKHRIYTYIGRYIHVASISLIPYLPTYLSLSLSSSYSAGGANLTASKVRKGKKGEKRKMKKEKRNQTAFYFSFQITSF